MIEFQTDTKCNQGAPDLMGSTMAYTFDDKPGKCTIYMEWRNMTDYNRKMRLKSSPMVTNIPEIIWVLTLLSSLFPSLNMV